MPLTEAQLQNWIQSFPVEDLAHQGWSPSSLLADCLRHSCSFTQKNDQVAALICYYKPQSHVAEVLFLGTSPVYQKKGIMSQLLEQFLLEQKGNEVWLECREDNLSARHLYLKKGFKQIGRRPNYYKDGSAAILFNY
ncbi:GNAT family N-acetyltransferase [bacterium]|nr:GNAT family N-acetyltransferase [bacterium]